MQPRVERIRVVAALALFGLARPAFAQSSTSESATDASPGDRKEARRLNERGMRLFRAGDYEGAIAAFDVAYRLARAPLLLYNMAQAYRLHGDCARALALYRRFLQFSPHGDAANFAEERVLELAECGRVQSDAQEPPPATVVDGLAERRAAASAAEPRTAASAAGPRALQPAWQLGRKRAPSVVLQRAPLEGDRARHVSRRTWAIVGSGSTVLLLGLAGYFAWRADHASAQVSQAFSERGQWNAALAHTEEAGMRDSRLSIASLIAGSVTAGVTTWLWTFD